jgi:phosphoribosylformylglycinamidine synthase
MALSNADRRVIEAALDRGVSPAEAALFENLWSEHCAYRSSQPLLAAFESTGEDVVIGPGDDAAVVELPTEDTATETPFYLTMGIESHNHPSYVDPYDGAATGVGGIVRDTLSMGAYPIALADSLYFGPFDREHSQYLLNGVIEGIADYANAIGVPTVTGSVEFNPGYEGNPLVNVACIGLVTADRLVTAEATTAGNRLMIVGNPTGRDGLGGASFASEDLSDDAATEDRPAVQVGDPYAEKRLIEANEELLDADVIQAARDLGAAGLGGASAELVHKGNYGAHVDLNAVHQREPQMNAREILLAESQERMCYEIRPPDVETVMQIADKYDLGCSTIGSVTEGNYVCEFNGETVVDVPAELLADGAPMNDLEGISKPVSTEDVPDFDLQHAAEAVLRDPSTASKEWVYRQYDHEVGLRTARKPGDDAALLAIHETGTGVAMSSGSVPLWTDSAPYEGARAVMLENAINVAIKAATPIAAVDCLNGGNPEKPPVYEAFRQTVDGLATMADELSIPVVGGNVSLYNDSSTGPIPPTPTAALVGTKSGFDCPPRHFSGEGTAVLIGKLNHSLGGSTLLDVTGGQDAFPELPPDPAARLNAITEIARQPSTKSAHDISNGGLLVTLAEMITPETGLSVSLSSPTMLFTETPGRAVIETTDPAAVKTVFDDIAPVIELGAVQDDGHLSIQTPDSRCSFSYEELTSLRHVFADNFS